MKDWHNQENYNCRVTLDNGQDYLVYASWLHNQGYDQWKGWVCMAGSRRLYVDKNLEIYGGECQNDHLGSSIDGFKLLDSTICKRDTCTGCTDDLLVAKHR